MSGEQSPSNERIWRNAWGHVVANLRQDGDQIKDVQAFFEGPRHGWLYVHLHLVGMCAFVCRAPHYPNDFLGELVTALSAVLRDGGTTVAASEGEPDKFEFRFIRLPQERDVRFELFAFPSFESEAAEGERIILLEGSEDAVCRVFFEGLQQMQSQVSLETYQTEMRSPFPSVGLAELAELLEGESDEGA